MQGHGYYCCRSFEHALVKSKGCRDRSFRTRCRNELDQDTASPTALANAASRLSAAAEHTIRDLVASTSASAQQTGQLPKAAAQRWSALTSQVGQLASNNPLTDGLQGLKSSSANLSGAAAERLESLNSQLSQFASNNPLTNGLDRVSSRCVIHFCLNTQNGTWLNTWNCLLQ